MAFSNRVYRHSFTDSTCDSTSNSNFASSTSASATTFPSWPPGKVVCVGRNYADHAAELNNPLPDQPLLFLKPSTAMIGFSDSLALVARRGEHHFETEMTLLIGRPLRCCNQTEAMAAIAGVGVGLDLTLRGLQNELKGKGHPWERAKAFDGSCVLSPFARMTDDLRLQNLSFRLWKNNELVQEGNTSDMLFPVLSLIEEITQTFSLMPGDVIMTGTPKGVGPLAAGDILQAELDSLMTVKTKVRVETMVTERTTVALNNE